MFGLLKKKETCSVCNKELTRKNLADGLICSKCVELCGNHINTGNLQNTTISDVKKAIQKAAEDEKFIKNFSVSKKVGNFILFDDNQKKFMFPKALFSKARIYDYSEILSYEIQEDGEIVTKGGIGSALIGGALFGGVGAIVGGTTGKKTKQVINSLKVKITLKDRAKAVEYINIIDTETKSSSMIYRTLKKAADEIIATLEQIKNNNEQEKEQKIGEIKGTASAADEILKFKNLLDQGIITEEEFLKKKNELLGL